MLHALLKNEGLVINRKRTYRLYTELGMQVRTKRRKKLVRPRIPMSIPTQVTNAGRSTSYTINSLTAEGSAC